MRHEEQYRAAAIRLALDVFHFPARANSLRSAPLPDRVIDLVHIAAGDKQAIEIAAAKTGQSRQKVREAAAFFIEQVLLYRGADAYRVLGAKDDASHYELRRNMATLLRWLHPDSDCHGDRAIFATRVTEAWERLKTKERRAAYDSLRQRSRPEESRANQHGSAQSNRSRHNRQRPHFKSNVMHWRHPSAVAASRGDSLFRRIMTLLFGNARSSK